jgi:hypothetical protein
MLSDVQIHVRAQFCRHLGEKHAGLEEPRHDHHDVLADHPTGCQHNALHRHTQRNYRNHAFLNYTIRLRKTYSKGRAIAEYFTLMRVPATPQARRSLQLRAKTGGPSASSAFGKISTGLMRRFGRKSAG